MSDNAAALTKKQLIALGIALSAAAALSLGLGRFAYALLLSPMRAEFGWDYAAAGSLNTMNAVGYLIGALATPWLSRRFSVNALVSFGAWSLAALMAISPLLSTLNAWLAARTLAGVSSAMMFLLGGLLAARLGTVATQSSNRNTRAASAFIVALFYAGTGVGISLSAVAVPAVLAFAEVNGASTSRIAGLSGWAWGWLVLAMLAAACALALAWPLRVLRGHMSASQGREIVSQSSRWQSVAPYLMGYACFGLGYIGYMTFCIALLREKGGSNAVSFVFFLALGIACMFSAAVWGKLMKRADGKPMAVLMALCSAATWLVAFASHPFALIVSAIVFGGCFLQVVGSTTALVRHQWPPDEWARGITIFTCVFAAGQVVGPFATGLIADTALGLTGGLIMSAMVLLIGGVCALFQRGAAFATVPTRSV